MVTSPSHHDIPLRSLINLEENPFHLFSEWFTDAQEHEPNDPNAMSVATSTPDGHPSVRILLLKGMDERGFVFYTNSQSRKGEELHENPHASLLFYWKSLRRQVRIEGPVSSVSAEETDAYFASRSRISRLGAIASDQSRPLSNREIFEDRLQKTTDTFEGQDTIPRPAHWLGYRVLPERFEFWQERPYRLHDRAIWTRTPSHSSDSSTWDVTRLYP